MGNELIAEENLTIQKLDEILEIQYSYGILGFYLAFASIMSGLWSKSENRMTQIKAFRKEKNQLFESWRDYEKNLAQLCPNIVNKKVREASATRYVILDEITSTAYLKPHKVAKSLKIAAIWAQVMTKNGRIQWRDISNLMMWFQFEYEKNKEGEVLTKEQDLWLDPKYLSRYYFHLKNKYKETIIELRNFCFPKEGSEWDKKMKQIITKKIIMDIREEK